MASIKGGHCFTVRISRPWISECAFAGMARSQSGSAPRAAIGRGKCSDSAGSQRKIMRMAGLLGPEADMAAIIPALRANGQRECVPDDRLREAIHGAATGKVDCFASLAMT